MSSDSKPLQPLRVRGDKIVDGDGNPVLLRGAGLGGWMNQENFITGYPGREFQIRDALDQVLGAERAKFYWDKFLEYFFTDSDATFFHSLGLNCIRIAINYRHFEDDMNPRVLRPNGEGFKWLDRVVDICAKRGIYTIIDLHAAAGGQNTDWHSDNPTHVASFWTHKDFQDRAIWLWRELAAHYRSHPYIAGYNLLNEPTDPSPRAHRLREWYERCIAAVREIDLDHIVFLDGNTFASDWAGFDEYDQQELAKRFGTNTVYSVHDYSLYGFPKCKEVYTGTPEQKARVRNTYDKKVKWMKDRGLPIWNGEWGPVYARQQYDGPEWEKINESRYRLLKDQLEIYDEEEISWSIWLYKDIGFQGMVHLDLNTSFMKRFAELHQKKYTLAVDSWGASLHQPTVAPIYSALEDFVISAVPDESRRRLYPYPIWQFPDRVAKIARNILLAEFLVQEWAECFRGMDEAELDEFASCFRLERCVERKGLNQVLMEHRDASRKRA